MNKLVFLSDTQDYFWFESIYLKPNHNKQARDMIFDAIAASQAQAVFHLGDIVKMGYKAKLWSAFDQFRDKLSKQNIPTYAILGNHEYIFCPQKGYEEFHKRFPDQGKTGLLVEYQSTAIILLNSNFSKLSSKEIAEQNNWYIKTLKDCEESKDIKAIIVACHHSPMTNSKMASPSSKVVKFFVKYFQKNSKCKLFLSGHSHTFEHFKEFDKDFLVIGGGGGIQQPLKTGNNSLYNDLYSGSRMFHYLEYQIDDKEIEISIHMIKDDFSEFHKSYKFTIKL